MAEYVVAVDAMGGDHAPEAIVAGALEALAAYEGLKIQLYGPTHVLESLTGGSRENLEICDAQDIISMDEPPMLAVRRKTESSLVKAMLAVKDGRAQAVVSAGSTGAVLAGGILRIGRVPGVERPALAVVVPGRKKPFLLLDSGANVDCQSDYLVKFGLMGSIYMERVIGVKNPEVRLVNIGAEEEKGNKLSKETFQKMKAQTLYRFGGNIEARELPMGGCNVAVADGFDGNLLIKYTEGLSSALFGMLKDEMTKGLRAKIGAALLMPALRAFKKKLSYQEYGGAPLLGVKGAVVKAHGSSDKTAIKNAVRQAVAMIKGDVSGLIERGTEALVTAKEEAKGKEDEHV